MSLLSDGGFENTIANNGGGPLGNEIPKLNHLADPFEIREIGTKLLWPSNNTQAAVVGGLNSPYDWIQQDVDDTGGFKIRQFPEFPHGGDFNTDDSMPQSGVACAMLESGTNPTKKSTVLASDIQTCFDFKGTDFGGFNQNWEKRMVGWRVDPGAVITMTMRIKGITGGATTHGFVVAYYSELGFLKQSEPNFAGVPIAYETRTLSETVPALTGPSSFFQVVPKYVKIGFKASFSGGGIIVVDEVVLDITNNSPELDQEDEGRYKVSVNFEGQHLKSYAVVHKLHAIEAPKVVVLK